MAEDFKLLLKNSKFVHIWISQILSQLTINIVNFLLITTLFRQTGSAIATSLLWIAYALPALIAGPFSASAIDMLDKRKVLMVTNLLQATTILGYALIQNGGAFLPYGVVLIYSLLNQFYVPAEAASIPTVVSKKLLPSANGLFFMTQQTAIIAGFGSAGVINHFLGFENSLFLSSIFLFLAFVSVTFLPSLKPSAKIPKDIEAAFFSFFRAIFVGYNFIKANNKILVPFVLLVSLQVVVAVLAVNVPAIAEGLLGISLNSASLLLVVPAGLGTAFGAFFFPKLLKRGYRKRAMIESSLKGLAFSFILFAFLVPTVSDEISLFVSAGLTFLAGFSFIGIMIPSQTFLQEITPGGLRGRVFGNFWFIVTIVTLLPVLFSGAITELLGVRVLLLILGVSASLGYVISRRYAYQLIQHKLNVSNI